MKLNRRQLRRLIESTLYEQDTKGAATYGLLTGAGFVGTLMAIGKAVASEASDLVGVRTIQKMVPGLTESEFAYFMGETGVIAPSAIRDFLLRAAADGTIGGAPFSAAVAAQAALVGASAFGGYQLGSYIQDKMSGNDASGPEEKLAVSIKRHAKDMIGELGALGSLLPTWDTVSDEEYTAKAKKKGFKGLKPHEIDKKRLEELIGAILTGRCFTEDGKIPKAIDELFAFPYLDAYEFERLIKKREAKLIDNMVSEVDEEGEPVEPEKVNESLSRGSLYRRRYRRY